MSRLLMLLLLYLSGYIVLVSTFLLRKSLLTKKTPITKHCSRLPMTGHEGINDYLPFVRYMLGIIVAAYRDFSNRVELLTTKGLSKPDRIREVICGTTKKNHQVEDYGKMHGYQSYYSPAILTEMMNNNEIIKIGGGRYSSYAWNWENESLWLLEN